MSDELLRQEASRIELHDFGGTVIDSTNRVVEAHRKPRRHEKGSFPVPGAMSCDFRVCSVAHWGETSETRAAPMELPKPLDRRLPTEMTGSLPMPDFKFHEFAESVISKARWNADRPDDRSTAIDRYRH